jgi:glucose-6-phosphate-specific signal transduction histidine kinase
MNPMYGREREVFWNNFELRCTISFKCNLNESRNNDNSLFVLFQLFQQLIFNIFKTKNAFERKMFLLFKKDLHHGSESKENQ